MATETGEQKPYYFVSYSRKDSDFVDQIEADLRAREFEVWVDRRELEAGQDWTDQLQIAIDGCMGVLLIMSPDALESEFVRMEYRYALSQKKRVLPVLFRPVARVPIDLNHIQWITSFEEGYDEGLLKLLNNLAYDSATRRETAAPAPVAPGAPAPVVETGVDWEANLVVPEPAPTPPDPSLNELFLAGVSAKAVGDLDRCALFWQQVIDRDPNFENGVVKSELAEIEKQLHPIRIQRLRDRANAAHQKGEWGQEIGAWKALLRLSEDDKEATARIPIAEQNQKYSGMYQNARQLFENNDHRAAAEMLKMLWEHAPIYGDPEGIAKQLSVEAAPNLLTTKQKQQKQERLALIGYLLLLPVFLVVAVFPLLSATLDLTARGIDFPLGMSGNLLLGIFAVSYIGIAIFVLDDSNDQDGIMGMLWTIPILVAAALSPNKVNDLPVAAFYLISLGVLLGCGLGISVMIANLWQASKEHRDSYESIMNDVYIGNAGTIVSFGVVLIIVWIAWYAERLITGKKPMLVLTELAVRIVVVIGIQLLAAGIFAGLTAEQVRNSRLVQRLSVVMMVVALIAWVWFFLAGWEIIS